MAMLFYNVRRKDRKTVCLQKISLLLAKLGVLSYLSLQVYDSSPRGNAMKDMYLHEIRIKCLVWFLEEKQGEGFVFWGSTLS